MLTIKKQSLNIHEALSALGGFVKYFGTTEPLRHIVDLIPLSPCDNILTCCGGGDQALTFLGFLGNRGKVYAFDINAAQLFVLAYKASMIKENTLKSFEPSFNDLCRKKLGRIRGLPRDLRRVQKLFDIKKRKYKYLPKDFEDRFRYESDTGTYLFDKERIFWSEDKRFITKIKKNIGNLELIHSDLLYIAEWFQPLSLDVIYVSDISLHNIIPFYIEKLKSLTALLKPGAFVMGNKEGQEDLDRCPTIIEILENYTDLFDLKFYGRKGRLIALQKCL